MSAKPEVICNKILEAIQSNKLPLPSKPDIVGQIQEVAADPNVKVNDLFNVIKQDPALTARLLRLANSPLVRGKVAVNNLEIAISRMGVHFASNLAVGIALEQLFKTDNPMIAEYMDHTWHDCSQIAGIASVLSAHLTDIPADQAMLGGLLCDVGSLSILSYAEKNPELLEEPELINQLIENHTAKLSKNIMAAWQFAPALIKLPEEFNNFYENKSSPDLADILLVAKIHLVKSNPDHPLSQLDPTELPCFKRLNLDPQKSLDDYPEFENDLAAAKDIFK